MDERQRLLERLQETDLDREAIDEASEDGRLPALAVEAALGGNGRHTLTGLARESGLPAPYLRDLMQALGRTNPARGERAFTDEDVELAKIVRRLIDAGLPRGGLVEVARVIGQGMAQSADAVRQLVGNALLEAGDSEDALAVRSADTVDALAPLMPMLFDLAFRAHVREGLRRDMITEAERREGQLANTRDVAVAFADLVDYTRLGIEVGAEELGSVASRFADLATSCADGRVRLVKTLGDAGMFVSTDIPATVAAMANLSRSVQSADPPLPALRVGIAYGPASLRAGDWFGSTVNLASRVTEVADPGQMLVTEDVCAATPAMDWRKRRKRNLKGVHGRVRVFSYEGG
jgi:adenylate cyclase